MKRFLILALAALTLAAPAGATTRSERQLQDQITQLKAQVNALKTQVAAVQKEMKTLKKDTKFALNEASVNYFGDTCLAAITGDALVLTWMAIDQYMQTLSQPPLFGPQTFLNDKQSCSTLVPPTTRLQAPPFSLSPFTALINWMVPA